MSIDTTEPEVEASIPAPDFSRATDPFALFEQWFGDARAHEINDPNAMALATADADGLPNVRMVLLKGLDIADTGPSRGFVFYTNYDSAKGQELQALQKAALLFHWKSLRRQVRIRGAVSTVDATEADAYFATRARGSQIGAWASQQSRPLDSRAALEQAVARLSTEYEGRVVPRPAHWSGFRVTPLQIEFWHDRAFRLHERVTFRRPTAGADWQRSGLYP